MRRLHESPRIVGTFYFADGDPRRYSGDGERLHLRGLAIAALTIEQIVKPMLPAFDALLREQDRLRVTLPNRRARLNGITEPE